jgi:pimeloyl-ACP methyl ester carboxylesterase
MRNKKLQSLAITLLLLILAPTVTVSELARATLQPPTGTFEPTECMFELPIYSFMSPEAMGFECGYVTVPEQHAHPDGPTIRLPVAILPTKSDNPKPDPLFLAQGGPGGSAFDVFPLFTLGSSVPQERDLVIFNQRGTIYAEPELLCPELFEARPEILALADEEAKRREEEVLAACYQRLQAEDVNLSAFNSLENAADVEAIRAALGYGDINFYGVSYGTLLGLHLMRNYPDHLRSIILDGVVPPHLNFIPLVPQGEERIYRQMFEVCAADAICQAEYPDLEQRFSALVDRLNEQPISLSITDPETEQTIEAFLSGDVLMDVLFQIFYGPSTFAVFPKVVADMETGDYRFLETWWPELALMRTMSDGMYYSVICAEDADFNPTDVPLDGVRPQIAKNVVSDLQSFVDVCELWQVDRLPSTIDKPVVSDIPSLLLSGQFDPITPPAFAAAAAEHLPNSYNYIYPAGSHGVAFGSDCVDQIIQDFLDNPTVEPNSACLAGASPAGFVPNDVLKVDLIGQVNTLDPDALIQLGMAALFLVGLLSAYIIWPLGFIISLLRTKKTETKPVRKRLRWISRGLIILFSLLATLFLIGLIYFSFQALSSPLLMLSAMSGSAAPLFVIPFILVLLAVGIVVALVMAWGKSGWSIWDRLYYTLLATCAVGYVVMLSISGLLTVLV